MIFSEEEQNILILNHMHFIPRIARRLKNKLYSAEEDELISAGYLALVIAARTYRAENNCQFTTYMYTLVTGKMIKAFAQPEGKKGYKDWKWEPLSVSYHDKPTHLPNPYQVTAHNEQIKKLGQAYYKLAPKYREILWLKFGMDLELSKKEIYTQEYKTFRTAMSQLKDVFHDKPIGVSPQSLKNLRNRNEKTHISNDLGKELYAKYCTGKVEYTMKNLSKQYNVHVTTINRLFQKQNDYMSLVKKFSSKINPQEVYTKYISGNPEHTMKNLGRFYNVSASTISNMIRNYRHQHGLPRVTQRNKSKTLIKDQ